MSLVSGEVAGGLLSICGVAAFLGVEEEALLPAVRGGETDALGLMGTHIVW